MQKFINVCANGKFLVPMVRRILMLLSMAVGDTRDNEYDNENNNDIVYLLIFTDEFHTVSQSGTHLFISLS